MKIIRTFIAGLLSLMIGIQLSSCSSNIKEGISDSSDAIDTISLVDSVSAAPARPLTIAMVGDIMMGTSWTNHGSRLTADDGASLFQDASEILKSVDIAAGNLEGTLFDGEGKPKPCYNPQRYFTFKMPERYVNHLLDAGFDFVSIANNHVNDFGPEAYESTQKVLDKAGLAYAGVSDKKPTAIIEKDGRKIGFTAFGFSPGMPNVNDYDALKTLVSGLRDECDIVVVSFHGGAEGKEFQHVPHKRELTSGDRGNVEEFAHLAIDAGADVVYGHSPHVPRAVELYKDRIIFYSLGNFCTPYEFNLTGVNGLAPLAVVTINPDGTFLDGKIHSFKQSSGIGPRKDPSNEAARKIKELTKADFPDTPLTITDDGDISKK